MSNQIQPFAFEDHLVRAIMQGDEPWFVAGDVCRVLGVQNVAQAVERLDDDEKGICSTYTLGGDQEMIIVSESGLYTIILRSRAATTPGSVAHRFRKWVTGDVLPSIRRTGRYETPGAGNADEEPLGLGPLPEIAVRARLVELTERLSGKPAARALWRRLGLPTVEEMERSDLQPPQVSEGEEDPVDAFLTACVRPKFGSDVQARVMYLAFTAFCDTNAIIALKEKSFSLALKRRGLVREDGRIRRWIGVELHGALD